MSKRSSKAGRKRSRSARAATGAEPSHCPPVGDGDLDEVVAALGAPDEELRRQGVAQLLDVLRTGASGGHLARSIELLRSASTDPSHAVREDVARALLHLPDEEGREALLARLEADRDAFVQRAAADTRQRLRRGLPRPPEDDDSDAAVARRLRELERRYGRKVRQEFEAVLRPWLAQAAGAVGHELRPLLSAVFNALKLYERGREDREWSDTLAKVDRWFDLIERILIDFEDYVRAAPRPEELRRERVEELIEEACKLVREGRSAGVAIVLRSEVEPGHEVLVARHRLLQALRNLLQNSFDALEELRPRRGEVVVSAVRSGQEVIVQVRDDGPGLPKELMGRKLFSPGGSTKPGHTGFGLPNASQIVRDLGGWIDYDSVEGEGTTFTIGLPCAPDTGQGGS